MSGFGMEMKGGEKLLRLIHDAQEAGKSDEMLQAFSDVGGEVLKESLQIVPYRFGPLSNSARLHRPVATDKSVEVRISYGGPSAPYAVYVHEDMTARHKPGKTAKYLEKPMKAMAPRFARRVKEAFAARLRRAG